MGVLIEVGADVNATGPAGQTALHIAAGLGRYRFVQALLWWGADPHRLDDRGRTAFDIAAYLCEPYPAERALLFAAGTDDKRLVQATACASEPGLGDHELRVSAMVRAGSRGWYQGARVDVDEIPRPTVKAWLTMIAAASGLNQSELHVVYAEQGKWRDGCIGSYPPGALCTKGIVPGWRAIIGDSDGVWSWLHEGGGRMFRWPEETPHGSTW